MIAPTMTSRTAFPSEVITELKTYVYRLLDPRNGETFYVGKGQGNRVFAHVRDADGLEGDELDNKLRRIREIRRQGLEVAHVIHRHGMDDATALQVESAVMDAYPGLANVATGTGTSSYGAMHAEEIIQRYGASPAVLEHRALLINVNRSSEELSLYEATRYAWILDRRRAERAELVLATVRGLIVDVFVPMRWLDATAENFPGREARPGRIGFEGTDAEPAIKRLYVGKRVPAEFRPPGAANPVRYTF